MADLMTPGWTDWEGFADTPYVNWGQELAGKGDQQPDTNQQTNAAEAKACWSETLEGLRNQKTRVTADDLDRAYGALLKMALARLRVDVSQLPPFPTDAINSGPGSADTLQHYFDWVGNCGTIPSALKGDTLHDALHLDESGAIIGVIDLGVPLGQQRTRLADQETTRILASWQQSASRQGLVPEDQEYLPFGREVLAGEICNLIGQHSKAGRFDEEAFNRDSGVEDYRRPLGQRELGLRAAHGAHVLDCAAGIDATASAAHAAEARQKRIIAVNLPARELVGHAAEHLEFFAVFGLLRISTLADAIWEANKRVGTVTGDAGYAIVVNFSFGKQAGARDGMDLIADVLRNLNEARRLAGYRPIFLSMPAGNENLERGNARLLLQPGAVESLNWRIKPEDQSANFLEIWAEHPANTSTHESMALEIEVQTPDGACISAFSEGVAGQARSLCDDKGNTLARLYATNREGRVAYILATRCTLLYGEAKVLAPAGLWKIRIQNKSGRPLQIAASSQTDQTEKPNSVTNQRSYFDHVAYERVDPSGRLNDSYSYPLDGTAPVPEDSSNLIRRHGTLNAMGRNKNTLVAAAFQSSDGRMTAYSATGVAHVDACSQTQPTAAVPSRAGAAHFGRIAASGRDGAGVALEGTSVSAAVLTRRFVDFLLSPSCIDFDQAIEDFQQIAAEEDGAARYPGCVVRPKAGSGRMNASHQNENLARFRRGIRRRSSP